jgi:hypothetical protein
MVVGRPRRPTLGSTSIDAETSRELQKMTDWDGISKRDEYSDMNAGNEHQKLAKWAP